MKIKLEVIEKKEIEINLNDLTPEQKKYFLLYEEDDDVSEIESRFLYDNSVWEMLGAVTDEEWENITDFDIELEEDETLEPLKYYLYTDLDDDNQFVITARNKVERDENLKYWHFNNVVFEETITKEEAYKNDLEIY